MPETSAPATETRPAVHFIEEPHRYELELASGRVEVPSVTQILEDLRLAQDFPWLDPYYAERGRAVHAAIAHWLRSGATAAEVDDVFEEPLAEDVRRLVLPALEVCEALALEPVLVEAPLADPVLLYAGTGDVVGIAHRPATVGPRAVGVPAGVVGIDWKANLYLGRDLQLAAYWRLWLQEFEAGGWSFFTQREFARGHFLTVGLDNGPRPSPVGQLPVLAELFTGAVRLYHHKRGALL